MAEILKEGGAFLASLKRDAKQIRSDRAQTIAEDAQQQYKRAIEDMELELRKLLRKVNNSLDLSPTDINSLVMGEDFDGQAFTDKDIKTAISIRNLEVKIQVAQARYHKLFVSKESEEEPVEGTEIVPETV